jgi:hypothetical protein
MYDVKSGVVEFCEDAMFINDKQNPTFSLNDFRS